MTLHPCFQPASPQLPIPTPLQKQSTEWTKRQWVHQNKKIGQTGESVPGVVLPGWINVPAPSTARCNRFAALNEPGGTCPVALHLNIQGAVENVPFYIGPKVWLALALAMTLPTDTCAGVPPAAKALGTISPCVFMEHIIPPWCLQNNSLRDDILRYW